MEPKPQEQKTETRPPDTEILAEEAVAGFWYIVPSGEIERCAGQRKRGRGTQVGFVSMADPGNDPEEVRWLQGRTSICVANELDAASWMRGIREKGKGRPSELDFALCPRNGLICSICELPQRETPAGTTCETLGHGGADGKSPTEVANQLAENGYTEEARVVLDSVPPSSTNPNILNPDAENEADQSLPEGPLDLGNSLEQLAARTADQLMPNLRQQELLAGIDLAIEQASADHRAIMDGRKLAGPSTVFHKSLHIDWRTPKELFAAQVARWGPYWLDAAATAENRLCEYWLGPGSGAEDSLTVPWAPTPEIIDQYGFNIWLNHPYSPGEKPCKDPCTKKKCPERGYHIDKEIMSSGDWMMYARNQALGDALALGGVLTCLTKRAGETGWWRDVVLTQPESAGAFISGRSDPRGGPAAEFMNSTPYPAAMWTELRWEHLIVDIVEIEGRVDFDRGGDDGSAGFPSAIVTYYRPGTR